MNGRREHETGRPSRALDLGDVAHEVDQAVAVAPLVVVPSDDLHEGGVEHDARLGVEHRRPRVVDEVLADHVLPATGRRIV